MRLPRTPPSGLHLPSRAARVWGLCAHRGAQRPWPLQVESAEGRLRGPLPHQVFPEDLPRLSPAATLAPGPWLCPQLAPTLRAPGS